MVGNTSGKKTGKDEANEAKKHEIEDMNDQLKRKEAENADLEGRLSYTRGKLTDAIEKKDLALHWLSAMQEVEDQEAEEDCEDFCEDTQDKMSNKRLADIADILKISNETDRDKLLDMIRRGYVNIVSVSEDGTSITLSDPTIDPDDESGISSEVYVDLEEPIEDIPEKYQEEEEPVSPVEKEINDKFESDGEKAITDYDLESVTDNLSRINQEVAIEATRNFQEKFASTQGEINRKTLFCSMMATIGREYISQLPEDDISESGEGYEQTQADQAFDAYITNTGRMLGLDDIEECMLYVQDPGECHCD